MRSFHKQAKNQKQGIQTRSAEADLHNTKTIEIQVGNA